MRALFPMSMRGPGEEFNKDGDPENKFVFGFFDLPLDVAADSKKLVLSVKYQTDGIKVNPA
jgi:hypothetical protein